MADTFTVKYRRRWRALLSVDGSIRHLLASEPPADVTRTLKAWRREVRRELRDIERVFRFVRPIHSRK